MFSNLFDAEARVAAIYPIELIGDAGNPPEWVYQLASRSETSGSSVFHDHAELSKLLDPRPFADREEHAMAIADAWLLAGRKGYVVAVQLAVRQYVGVDAFYSSWAYFQSFFIYAASIDDVLPKVLNLADRQREAERLEYLDQIGVK